MEGALVKAALSVVGTALSPFKDSLLEKWAASNKLGSNVKDLELELLAVQALLEHTVGKEIVDNSALKRILVTLQDLGYDAEDVLDELEYFRIQDELDSTFEAADEHATGCACDLCLHVCHTANAACKQIASWFTCFCAAAPAGCKARIHDHVGKHSPCSCLPCVGDGPRKLKFDRVDASTRMKHIVEKLRVVRGIVSSTFTALGSNNLITVPDIAQSRPITTSESTEPKLYGRKRMKNNIIRDITKGKHSREALTVIPIFGLAGIGKTALAQQIYHSKKVQRHFEVKVWTCVSLNFNVNRLTEEIKKGVPEVDGESGTTRELIEQRLRNKKFLLVLDDIWNCGNEDEWKQLLAPFEKSQVKGNIIMVTTRFQAQAQIMVQKDDHSIHLKGLENKEFKKLCLNIVFGADKPRQVDKSLLEIGDKIVDKLKGSPLAAKTVGRLLRTHINLEHWIRVLKSKEWMETKGANDIMPALKLSYYYLPAQLQRCFSYCSLFPQDYKFEREELINFWIGLDVLHSSHGENKRVEDVGLSHLTELVNYGFFEKEAKKDGSTCYIVHDLIHELAQKVSSHECLSIESSQSQVSSLQIPPSIRHLSINIDDTSVNDRLTFNNCVDNLNTLDKRLRIEKVRSLLLFGKYHGCFVKVFGHLFREAKALRVVFLSKASYYLEDLLCNFHNFVHLRYLRVESSSLVQTKFPYIFSRFYHMIVLDTKHCDIDLLPRDMSNLGKLRHFLVQKGSTHSRIAKVGKIKSLQELRSFVVRQKGKGFELKQIGHLVELCGSLCIANLENVQAKEEADEAKLLQKSHIRELTLQWTIDRSTNDSTLEEHVLERLKPSSNLLKLCIIGHKGATCPSWLGTNPSVESLESLHLYGLAWKTFPPIGDLWLVDVPREEISIKISNKSFENLRRLRLGNLQMLEKWVVDSPCQLLPLLEELVIQDCSKLLELSFSHSACCSQEKEVFPKLSELTITNCPMLRSIPAVPWTEAPCYIEIRGTKIGILDKLVCETDSRSRYSPVLKPIYKYSLRIEGGDTPDETFWDALAFRYLTKLEQLWMFGCQPLPLHYLQLLSSLRDLRMSCSTDAFPFLEGNSIVQYQFPVESMTIDQWNASGKQLTQLLSYFPKLSDLSLSKCEKITGLGGVVGQEATATPGPSSSAHKVDKAQIEQDSIPEEDIVALAAEGLLFLPPRLQKLVIEYCPKLTLCSYPANYNDNNKQDRPTATEEGGWLQGLNSLQQLIIKDCPNLLSTYESPSFSGFPFPTSLKRLKLEGALGMKTLEPLSNLSSLTRLSIEECGDLKSEGLLSLLAQGHLTELVVQQTPGFFVDSEPTQSQYDNELPFSSSKLQDLKTDDVIGATCTPMRTLLFSSLTTLQIILGYAVMVEFTEQQLQFISSLEMRPKDKLPSSLQELAIQSCPKIQLLPKGCLPSSLQKLTINSCPAIRSLPKVEDFPSSLQELNVSGSGSGELKKQCRKLIGIVPIVKA
ncbi:unnamed protein product [Urochloa decumbens]|uniref:AAA+ ATPase domain-containing protein n=1 Tax=Urochloa decumbens TaxID=240449 RepID=A0ABC8VHM9_9POAL